MKKYEFEHGESIYESVDFVLTKPPYTVRLKRNEPEFKLRPVLFGIHEGRDQVLQVNTEASSTQRHLL